MAEQKKTSTKSTPKKVQSTAEKTKETESNDYDTILEAQLKAEQAIINSMNVIKEAVANQVKNNT